MRTLPLCLDAVLRQTRRPDAVYVVDNGSADGTYEWLVEYAKQEPRLRVLREAKRGPSAARNTALRVIQSGIVAFTDADCVPDREWLANLAAVFDDPSVAAVAGPVVGYEPGTLIERYLSIIGFSLPDHLIRVRKCAPHVGFPTANLCVRVAALQRIGWFDEAMEAGEDYDLCWRILRAGDTIIYTPEARVAHIHRATLRMMLRRVFEYGTHRPMLMRKHFGGIAYVVVGPWTVMTRSPATIYINLTSPDKISLVLLALSIVSPWCLGLLGLYWMRLALRVKRAAQRQGIKVRTTGELALLTALHLMEFCASGAGRLIASPKYGVLCM